MRHLLFIAAMGLCLTGCLNDVKESNVPFPDVEAALPVFNANPANFSSCTELRGYLDEKNRQYEYENAKYLNWLDHQQPGPVPYPADMQPVSGIVATPVTNNQVAGVDEGDTVKADDDRIYLARRHSVEIVNKATLTVSQTLEFPEYGDIKLLLYQDQLVVIATMRSYVALMPTYSDPVMLVKRYRLDLNGRFQPTHEEELKGYALEVRLKDGELVIVTNSYYSWTDTLSYGKLAGIECAKLRRPVWDDLNRSITGVHFIDLANDRAASSTGIMAYSYGLHRSSDSLYVWGSGLNWYYWDKRIDTTNAWRKNSVLKFNLGGAPQYHAAVEIPGWIRDTRSMFERAGSLWVATSEWGANGANHIYVYDSDLQLTAVSAEFAAGEMITASHFQGNRAYIVTFRSTDPVFIFDISTTGAPTLMSHLEVTGFSSYLHPVGTDLLLGVGTSGDGRMQVSLFNTQNDSVQLITRSSFGERYSRAFSSRDPRAFYFDLASGLLVLPASLLDSAQQSEFTGALVFTSTSNLTPAARLSHDTLMPATCKDYVTSHAAWMTQPPDINRVLFDGSELIALSPFGITVHDAQFAITQSLAFSDNASECDDIINGH